MNNLQPSFRFAQRKDTGLILAFIKALAEYEKMAGNVIATEELLEEWIFDKGKAEVLFVVENGILGNEFAQGREWNHDASLDWHLLEGGDNWHHGVQRLVRDLNLTYRHHKAMHELDFDPYGPCFDGPE